MEMQKYKKKFTLQYIMIIFQTKLHTNNKKIVSLHSNISFKETWKKLVIIYSASLPSGRKSN